MFYQEKISAAAPLHINVSGRYFLLESTGDQPSVAVTLLRNGSPIFGRIPAAKRGHKYGVESGFDGVRIESAGDTTVQFFATFENVSISTTDGAQVEVPGGVMITNALADPVPVVHTGTVNLTANYALANTVINAEPMTVNDEPVVFLIANANRRGFRILNTGPDSVAIGGAGLVFSNAVLMLGPGQGYIETNAPGAAWYAVTESGSSNINIQELIL